MLENFNDKKYQITEIIKVYKTNGIELSNRKLDIYNLDQIDKIVIKILEFSQKKKLRRFLSAIIRTAIQVL